MKVKTEECLLWGHSLREYQQMFDLSPHDLDKKTLDCASGFASFNAEMHASGKHAVSCDKAYNLPVEQLRLHVEQGLENMLTKVNHHQDQFLWQHHLNLEIFMNNSRQTLNKFMKDFPMGKREGRYEAASLPDLPFADNEFNLALCAYFLFSSHENNLDFHTASIMEMCRVAKEARIFPLLDSSGEPSAIVAPVILMLQQHNYGIEIKQVAYEFQRGGNAMLRVWQQTCEVK